MKSWLFGILRIFMDFFLLWLLLAVAAGLAASLDHPSLANLSRRLLEASGRTFPLALGGALILAAPTWRHDEVRPVAAWAGMLLAAVLLSSAGLLLRRIELPPAPPVRTMASLPTDRFIESGERAVAVRGWEEDRALEVALVDFGLRGQPRLAWAPELAFREGRIQAGDREFEVLAESQGSPFAAETLFGREGALIARVGRARLEELDRRDLVPTLVAGLGFSLLLAGTVLPALRTRWPLAGLVAATIGVALAFALDLALASSSIQSLTVPIGESLGLPQGILEAAAEGLAGLMAALLALIPRRGEAA